MRSGIPSGPWLASPLRSSPDWKRSLITLWFAVWVTATGMWAMVPFLTYIVEDLGITDPVTRNIWTGVLVAAAPVMAALMGPVWGGIGDRYSRKAMVLRGVGAIALFVGLMSFVRTPWELLGLRLLQGLFSGYVPPSITLVSVQAPVNRQGVVAGLLQSAMHAGAVSGYAMGGIIAASGDMADVFPICAGLAVAGFLAVLLWVREEPRPTTSRFSLPGAVRALREDLRYVMGLRSLVKLLLLVVVVRALVASVNPSFARYVEEVGGERAGVGWLFSAEALVLLLAAPLWGRMVEGTGPRRVFSLCALGLGLSYGAQAMVTSYGALLGCRLVAGVAAGGIMPACYAMSMRESHRDRRGSATGVVFMAMALSHAGGAALGGPLLNVLDYGGLLALVGGAACLMAALSWIQRSGSSGASVASRPD